MNDTEKTAQETKPAEETGKPRRRRAWRVKDFRRGPGRPKGSKNRKKARRKGQAGFDVVVKRMKAIKKQMKKLEREYTRLKKGL